MREFNQSSELFRETGGVHGCALSYSKGIIFSEEDIGRHNAMDKLIGRARLERIDLSDKFVLTTGRISSELLIKASKQGIPIIASRSAPTELAIKLAKETGVTLIGFARGDKLNIYSGNMK
jgi:FdhD protein